MATSAAKLQQSTQSAKGFLNLPVIVLGSVCIASTFFLFVGAFTAVPDTNISIECVTSAASVHSETLQTVLLFALGYVCTLAAKRRNDIARQACRVLSLITDTMCPLCSTATSLIATVASARPTSFSFARPTWMNKGVMAIVMASSLCTLCISVLLVGAFTAELDADYSIDDGLASESSQTMRVFTLGWIFIMAFKLRRELVGLVGDCCLLQPW